MKLSKWETSLFFTVLLLKHNECNTYDKFFDLQSFLMMVVLLHFLNTRAYLYIFVS